MAPEEKTSPDPIEAARERLRHGDDADAEARLEVLTEVYEALEGALDEQTPSPRH